MATIERALADEGPLTRIQLRERLDSASVRTEGQAMIHLLFLAAAARHGRARADGRQAARLRARARLARSSRSRRSRQGAGRAGPPLPGRSPAGERSRPRQVGGPAAARRPRRPEGDRRSELEEGEDGLRPARQAPRRRRRSRRRACSAPSTRSCSAGPRASRSSAATSPAWSPAASFAPSRWPTAAPSPAGDWAKGEATSEPYERLIPTKHAAALEADAVDVARFLTAV